MRELHNYARRLNEQCVFIYARIEWEYTWRRFLPHACSNTEGMSNGERSETIFETIVLSLYVITWELSVMNNAQVWFREIFLFDRVERAD